MQHTSVCPKALQELKQSGDFDPDWYRKKYADVNILGMDPVEHYLWLGQRLGRRPTKGSPIPEVPHLRNISYPEWVARYDTITEKDLISMSHIISTWKTLPTFSIIMPVYNTPEKLLREAINSVQNQVYENWELCIADDNSSAPHVRSILEEYSIHDPRIKIIYRKKNGHISAASNSAIEISTGEWIALLDHDDLLRPHALYCMAYAIINNPHVRLLYSDEDKINLDGQRDGPYFKCDWNLELFRSHNLITHLGVYHRSLIEHIGGFRREFDGAQDYDMALRCVERIKPEQICHIPLILYHWRMVAGSTALASDEKPYAMVAGERALNEHYARLGIKATAKLMGFGFKTVYDLGDHPPLVSIIIPTRNAKDLVERCINSIKIRTTYPNYEIVLIDNGSDDPKALAYFSKISTDPKIKVIRDKQPFNYSALNNNAVQYCMGEILILLNNDIEIISPDWIDALVGYTLQPDIGAVGAKLLYPNDRVQHAGIIMGLGGLAAHAHHGFGRKDAGYNARLALTSEFSAVTGACLAVKKEHYMWVGGLNETDLTVAYNDVDFCLKLKAKGLRNIYVSHVELYHHESATRGYEYETPEKQARFAKEKEYMHRIWGDIMSYDPAYSSNLTLRSADFSLASPPRVGIPVL